MKRNITSLLTALTIIAVVCSSCMKDSHNEIELSSSAMITNLYLGTLKRAMHKLDSHGNDSLYYSTYTASDYRFRIDQIQDSIYNPEPLLYNTKLDAVLLNITSTGTVFWRQVSDDPNADDWNVYKSTDSVDVSKPIILRVFSYDGKQQRDYTLKVRSYKKSPDSLTWTRHKDCEALAENTVQRAVLLDGQLIVIGRTVAGEVAMTKAVGEGTRQVCNGANDIDVTSLTRAGSTLYAATTAGRLIASTNGIDWTDAGQEATALAGVDGNGNLYALNVNGTQPAYKLLNMLQATPLTLDSEAKYLPTNSVCGAVATIEENLCYHVVAGMRDEAFGDTCAVVWSCRQGTSTLMYYPNNANKNFTLPALNDLHLLQHNGKLIAIGGSNKYGSTRTALGAIYNSLDCGLTWNTRLAWTVPTELKGRTQPLAVAAGKDDEPFYVVSGTQVWEVVSNKLDAI